MSPVALALLAVLATYAVLVTVRLLVSDDRWDVAARAVGVVIALVLFVLFVLLFSRLGASP